jgi:hypothetical protein
MRQDIAERWVAELLSGKYEQCRRVLRTSKEQFCCLGVLCEIAVQDNVIAPPPVLLPGELWYTYAGGCTGVLPSPVQEWSGFAGSAEYTPLTTQNLMECGLLTDAEIRLLRPMYQDEAFSLAELNDLGISFASIAALIQRFWKDL